MKLSKKHLMLKLKKKSGAELSAEEAKELETAEAAAKKAEEDKKKEEDEKKKAEDDKKKEEEDKKKPEPEKKAEGAGAMSLEDLGKAVAQLSDNVNMVMEALAALMEQGTPAEEAKEEPKKEEESKEDDAKKDEEEKKEEGDKESDEEEMTEEEMEKELEKTIAELESMEEA